MINNKEVNSKDLTINCCGSNILCNAKFMEYLGLIYFSSMIIITRGKKKTYIIKNC